MSNRNSMIQRGKRQVLRFFGGASLRDVGRARPLPFRSLRGFEPLETRRLLYGEDLTGSGEAANDELVADFSLTDLNPSSSTYQQALSPRDFLDQVSVWMFGWSS
ncbi:MAG: hypothetical protein ACC628_08095 [Pirellulaceae bacterium]